MRKRVLIVDLQQIYKIVRALYVPLVYGTLRVHAEQDAVVREGCEFLEPLCVPASVPSMMEAVDAPDVVGFSTYVWNERNSHRLARAIKERYPSCVVVFGGPQIPRSACSYLAEHPWVDVLVHGEGEQAFTGILREVVTGRRSWGSVPGLSFLVEGQQVFSAPGTRMADLDLPSPFLRGYFDAFVERHRALGYLLVASLETSRGCPYTCAFCNWGMATGTKPRAFSEERVRAEFDWVASRKISMVFLIDANFGIFARDVAFMERLAELKRERGFPHSVVVSGFAKNSKDRTFEITRILQDDGLDKAVTVNFSLQATSQMALDAIDRQNIPLDSYRALSDKYALSGYTLTPDLIFPLPGETLQSFMDGYSDLASWAHVSRIRVYPLTILPNTPMDEPAYRERWGLVTRVEQLRTLLLEPECAGLEDEVVENVISTRLISEAEVTRAKQFVVFVNALEIYHLTSSLRRGLREISAVAFYAGFLAWQLAHDGVLAGALRGMMAAFGAGTHNCEELGWSGECETFDGQRMMAVKALTYDALMRAERFQDELRSYVIDALGTEGPHIEELLEFQSDAWVRPSYDPEAGVGGSYLRDWVTYLQGGPLDAVSVSVSYPVRTSVAQFGYVPGPDQWKQHFLMPFQPDTLCAYAVGEAAVERGSRGGDF